MKLLLITAGALLAASLHAAEPAPIDAEPAVNTSPAAPRPAAADPARPATATAAPTAPAQANTAPPPAPNTRPASTDRIELGTTQITGNSELPRVMYVVPWKKAELGDIAGRPTKSLLDEVLAPVDRDVFRRQNRYYDALQPDAATVAPEGEK
jgi:hypothetical protein